MIPPSAAGPARVAQSGVVTDVVVEFYSGTATDHRGRSLREIQQWSDDRLEAVHDYIQWLFPLPEPSPVNPLAPLLREATIEAFAARAELRDNLRASLDRMLRFYGLGLHDGPPPIVLRTGDSAARASNWLRAGNHNHLRITRILKCCTLLGLGPEARAFLQCLEEIYQDQQRQKHPGINGESMRYWRGAIGGPR
jgi:hypothetical protein